MPISQITRLFALVKSMDKSEKRHFRLYVNRLESNEDVLYVKLFDHLDKANSLNEIDLKSKLGIVSTSQYSNLKRHLYAQVLKSLRLVYVSKEKVIAIRELMDYATVLYNKSLFTESRLILSKASALVDEIQDYTLGFEVIEHQKKIASLLISNNVTDASNLKNLMESSKQAQAKFNSSCTLSNLVLMTQSLKHQFTFVKNEREQNLLFEFYHSNFQRIDINSLQFYTRVQWFKAHYLFNHMCLNFQLSYKYALNWNRAFEHSPTMKSLYFEAYIEGLHYILQILFFLNNKRRFKKWFNLLKTSAYSQNHKPSKTIDQQKFLFFQTAQLNKAIIYNNFTSIDAITKLISEQVITFADSIGSDTIVAFYYKFGLVYSYKGNYEKAIDCFNKIVVESSDKSNHIYYSYARLALLICHFRQGHFQFVDNTLQNVRQTFNSNQLTNKPVDIVLSFLRRGCRAMNFGIQDDYTDVISKLKKHENNHFEKVAFLYYNFIGLFESLSENDTIEKTLNKKINAH